MNIYVGSFGQVPISDETLAETNNLDRRSSDVRTFIRDIETILQLEWEMSDYWYLGTKQDFDLVL